MRVCFLSRSAQAHGPGGMERHLHILGRELVRRGHSATVITTSLPAARGGASGPDAVKEIEGVEYRHLGGTPPGAYSGKWWSASRSAFRRVEADLVHGQSIGAHSVSKDVRARRLPLVATCHGTPLSDAATSLKSHGLRANPAHLLSGLGKLPRHLQVYGKSDRTIAVSTPLAEHLLKYGLVPEQRLRVVLNGIDADLFRPRQGDEPVPWEEGRGPVLFSIARVVKEKGFHFILEALPNVLREHPRALLVIGGEGPFLPHLVSEARRLGVERSVLFPGRIPDEKLPRFYRSCDLFVLATTHIEGLPLVLPEALASGVPLLASRVGGIPEVVREGETGRLVPPGDARALGGALAEMLSDPERLRRMGRAAREDALSRFSAGRMARETLAVYEEALSALKGA